MARWKKILIGVVVVVGFLAGSAAVVPRLLWGDGVDYSAVGSIKATSEYQDPALLARAWELPVAKTYKGGLDFQRNGSFCGPTSVVNIARSLGDTAASQDKILDGTDVSTVLGVLPGGLTLDELAAVAAKKLPNKKVTVVRDIDLAALRTLVARANDEGVRLVVNFHRGPLFGTGGGHHSPIAGYLADQDLVFVLDVNEKYQPWLVKTDRLFAAVDTVDGSSGKKRGLLVIE
jgi:hypothetical protein